MRNKIEKLFFYYFYNLSISKFFIVLSFLGTIFLYLNPEISVLGLNDLFIKKGNYLIFLFQIFISNFLHGNLIHFLFNSIFIYYFGSILELIIGRKKFLIFFIFTSIFNSIFIVFLSTGTTIGISGFCMALLSYYTLELKFKNNSEYKGGITAIILNLIIGLDPQVSFYGHFSGVIAGIIFYFLNKELFRKKMIGLKNIGKTPL